MLISCLVHDRWASPVTPPAPAGELLSFPLATPAPAPTFTKQVLVRDLPGQLGLCLARFAPHRRQGALFLGSQASLLFRSLCQQPLVLPYRDQGIAHGPPAPANPSSVSCLSPRRVVSVACVHLIEGPPPNLPHPEAFPLSELPEAPGGGCAKSTS